jgi:hypothetical protein
MPIDYRKYPPDWGDISKRIRDRAGNVCEECGVPNGSHVTRAKGDRSQWTQVEAGKGTRIVLTVHHIGVDHADGTPGDPRDKMDVRDENLIALCQACHLAADLDHHIAEARKTRARKRHEQIVQAGQRRLI